MASQDARLSKFEADFKRQQGEMTNKIDTVLKAITDQIVGTLPSDTVKNPKLGTYLVSYALSYPKMDPQCSSYQSTSINAIKAHFKEDLHLNLPVLEVLAHTQIYNAILDKYVESLELGKNGSAFVQGEVPAKMVDPKLFTLPCRLKDSKPFDTLVDLGSRTPKPLVGRGFLDTANAVIDCRMAKIAVGEGFTRSVFGVKGVDLGEEEAPYWTALGKRESYKPRPSSDGVGAQTERLLRLPFARRIGNF
ncbi:hypothetical protein Tco_0366545 [Tanacetum coccineum]